MELRALAAVRRLEKEADQLQKLNQKTAGEGVAVAKKSVRNDVVVEEIGSDEEDIYEGKINDIDDENDPNEMTDNTPETRNTVSLSIRFYLIFIQIIFLFLSFSLFNKRCIVKLHNKKKKRLKENEQMHQRKEIMKKNIRKQQES